MSHNKVEELTAIGVLHDHIELLVGLDNLVKLNHVRVTNLLKNLNLTSDAFYILLVVNLFFLKNLHCNLKKTY